MSYKLPNLQKTPELINKQIRAIVALANLIGGLETDDKQLLDDIHEQLHHLRDALAYRARHHEEQKMKDIAEALGVTGSRATEILKRFVREVKRANQKGNHNPAYRYIGLIGLTPTNDVDAS